MGRLLLLAAGGLTLAACGRQEPATAPAAPGPPAVAASHWAFAIGKNSVELAWLTDPDATASAPLRLVCAKGDGFMVAASVFRPVGSEERLSIGAGDAAFALVAVADTDADGPLVRATGAIEEGLLVALESGKPIAASYGAQSFGPVDAPPPALRRAFGETCRKLASKTET